MCLALHIYTNTLRITFHILLWRDIFRQKSKHIQQEDLKLATSFLLAIFTFSSFLSTFSLQKFILVCSYCKTRSNLTPIPSPFPSPLRVAAEYGLKTLWLTCTTERSFWYIQQPFTPKDNLHKREFYDSGNTPSFLNENFHEDWTKELSLETFSSA